MAHIVLNEDTVRALKILKESADASFMCRELAHEGIGPLRAFVYDFLEKEEGLNRTPREERIDKERIVWKNIEQAFAARQPDPRRTI